MSTLPSVDRGGFVIGDGPFQPLAPVQAELSAAQAKIAELESERVALLNRERVETGTDLERLVARVLRNVAPDVDVSIEADDEESIVIRVDGAYVNEDDEIRKPAQEHEVEFTVTISGYLTIRAEDADAADDLAGETLREWVSELENTEPSHSDDIGYVHIGFPDLDHRVRGW